ncbi:hypothetical protein EYZ11_008259 [Aspergillus tanneri]|uniref:Uncharacterized protein n=1 Tax=Aspergillus tanneri TaxID=1220188 RepID=A0A4S3JD32_9EURO|nr:hypothetical protein EYZ11_008259 [Aspergillus tanneri]
MSVAIQLVRPTIRRFSVRRPRPDTLLPFVPPALESSREKSMGYPNHNKSVISCIPSMDLIG